MCSTVYTIVGEPFKVWVDQEIAKRNAKLVAEQNLAIDMDPEIAAAFHASGHISVQHGSSGHLMKVSTIA